MYGLNSTAEMTADRKSKLERDHPDQVVQLVGALS